MKHRQNKRRFGRTTEHRQAMFRNMVTSLIQAERVETTHARAKEVRRLADKMVTLGKNGSLHSRRRAAAVVRDKEALRKLFGDLAERYEERPGGYTRITSIGNRRGDNAPMAVIQFVEEEYRPGRRRRRRRRRAKATGEATAAKAEALSEESAKEAEAASTEEAGAESAEKVEAEAAEKPEAEADPEEKPEAEAAKKPEADPKE